jgi:hypothetical protein
VFPGAQINTFAGKSSLIHQAVYVCRTCGGEDEHKGCCAGIYHYYKARMLVFVADKTTKLKNRMHGCLSCWARYEIPWIWTVLL